MFALDLFNNDHERRLAEGAVDKLEQRRIDDLAMKMDDLVARAKKADTPEAKAALIKEFQKCKDERDSYFKIKDECMGYGGIVGEAGLPDVADKQAKMARLNQPDRVGADVVTSQQRVNPNPNKGIIGHAKDWLTGKGGLGKEGPTYESELDEQDAPATVAQGIYNEMIRAWQDEKDYIVLPFPDSHNATLTRPQLWNALVTLGQVTPNRRAKYVESKFNDFETFMRWASQLKRYKVPPKQKKNAQMSMDLQPQAVAPVAATNPQMPVAEAQKKNSKEPDLTGDTAQDASVQRELQRVRARHPAARSDIEALVKDEIVNQERVGQEIERLETIDSQQDDKLNRVLSLNTQQEAEITRLNQQLASLDGKLNQALGRAPAATPTTAPTKQVAEPVQPGTVSAPTPISAPITEPDAIAEPIADKSAAEIARLEKQIQQLELMMTLKTPAQQDDLRDRIDALEKERDAKIEKQQAATAKGVATRKANKAKAAAAVATDTAAKTAPKEKPADDELPFKGKGQAPGMAGISAMAGSNKSTAKSKYQKGGHDYLSDILSGAGKEHLTPDEQDQEIKFDPAELTSENTDNPLDYGSGQQLRRTPDIRRIKQVKDYERIFKQDMANRVQDRDVDDDEQDLRDVDETRAAIYRVGGAKPKFRYGTEAQHGLYGRVQVGRTDDDGRVQIHYQRNGKNYSHPVDPTTLNRTGDKVAEGNMKALAADGQSVPAVAGTYTVCKRKGADWVAIQPHDSKESAERHAQNIKNKYPSMQMAVRDPSGNYTEIGVKKPSAASKPSQVSQAYNDGAADKWYHRQPRNDYAKGTKDHQDYIDGYSGRRFTKEGVAEGATVAYTVLVVDPETYEKKKLNISALTKEHAKEKAEAKGYKVLRVDSEQGVAEAVPTIQGTAKSQPGADYTGEDLVRDANALFTAGGFKLADKEVEPRDIDDPKKINTTYYWRKKIKGLTPDQGQVQQLMIEIYNYAPKRTYWAINDWANDGARVTPDLAQKLWRRMEKTIKDSIDTAERENYWYSMTGNGKKPKGLEEDTGSWIVYDPETKQIKRRFKTHTAGKSYAQTHGLGFASSEYYFDQVKEKTVAENDDWDDGEWTDDPSQHVVVKSQQPTRYPESVLRAIQQNPAMRADIIRDYKRKQQQGVTETVTDIKSEMAKVYRRLAPKIERYRDSFLAGQLYDELENLAELHGAEAEFKRMMAGARNRAHMDYDTNPGGFQNWFWYLPFGDQEISEESSTSTDAVERAILHRIMVDDKLRNMAMDVGMDKVFQAVEEVAYNVGDVDEIGSSDVSGWINQVKQILGVEAR